MLHSPNTFHSNLKPAIYTTTHEIGDNKKTMSMKVQNQAN